MPDKLPSPREPLVSLQDGLLRINTTWFRYFFTNDLPTLNETLIAQAALIEAQAAQIQELQIAISTIRDVAIINTLTSAAEIPDLGRP